MGDYGKPKYAPSFWLRVLKAIDEELASPQDIVVIGGAAFGLHYKSPHLTTDIDTITGYRNHRELWAAVKRAQRRVMVEDDLEDPPPVNYTGVVSPPYNFEDRFEVVELGLKRLRVLVPERHDLALMKTSRRGS